MSASSDRSISPSSLAALGVRLLNESRESFPLCPAPYAELAARFGVAETAVLRALEQLRRDGRISRIGAVFSPKRVGASTMVAMAVPSAKLARVAEAVSRFPEVNRCDEREHEYNLWFIVTAGSEGRLQAALGAIEQAAGYPLLRLPLLKEFHLAGWPALTAAEDVAVPPRSEEKAVETQTIAPLTMLDEVGRRLVMALQEGLPIFIRPFSVLATRVGCDEAEVIERIRAWRVEGVIKRFGLVVPKQGSEDALSAILVLDVPESEVERTGTLLAREKGVPFCHQRQKMLPAWRYNVFCLLDGRIKDVLLANVAELRQRLGLTDYAYDILYPAH